MSEGPVVVVPRTTVVTVVAVSLAEVAEYWEQTMLACRRTMPGLPSSQKDSSAPAETMFLEALNWKIVGNTEGGAKFVCMGIVAVGVAARKQIHRAASWDSPPTMSGLD
jgi:hypothetical protein